MTRLLWLPDELHDAGLKVSSTAGWERRGAALRYDPRVVVDHHTAGPLRGDSPSLRICITGRVDVPGPLCNLLTGRDGTVHVVASGRSNNAGRGGAPQWDATHNRHTIGHEVEHTGNLATEPLNARQLEVIATADAVICAHYGWEAGRLIAHREWAPGRKIDPVWSQDSHRARVAHIIQKGRPDMSNTIRTQAGVAAMFDAYLWHRRPLPDGPYPGGNKPDRQAESYWRQRIATAVEADAHKSTTPTLDATITQLNQMLAKERAEHIGDSHE